MTYHVLARKYRPQSFREVIGQEHIVHTISNAIAQKRIHHAYLFSGARGTGKTTMARLLAKALNCVSGPTADICQSCDACKGIVSGNFVDVQEIDGASNRGIDEIRELRANVRFAPVSGRYKIYIIDEAHQITGAAFNALLKTLEEPPKHAVFILATTEPQSIPQTIASRCQKYNFRLLSISELSLSLENIIGSERIEAEPAAVELIARAANGSVRDAQSILDQAFAFCGGKLTGLKIKEMLGTLPAEFVEKTFDALSREDAAAAVRLLGEISRTGQDLSVFISEMLSYCHSFILKKVNVENALSEDERAILEKYSDKFSLEKLLRFSRILLKAKDETRWTDDVKFLLELYLVKMTLPFADASALKELLTVGDLPIAEANPSKLKVNDAGDLRKKTESRASNDFWSSFILSISSSEHRLKNILKSSKLKKLEDSAVEIESPSEFVLKELSLKKQVIESLLQKYCAKQMEVNLVLKKHHADDLAATEEKHSPIDDSMFAEPRYGKEVTHYSEGVKKFLDIFPGKVVQIEKASVDKKTC